MGWMSGQVHDKCVHVYELMNACNNLPNIHQLIHMHAFVFARGNADDCMD